MKTFYVVDRYNRYQPNQTVGLKDCTHNLPPDLKLTADQFFPNGVSAQGERYFFEAQTAIAHKELNIDWCFEFYRRATHTNRPSRWESLFAWKTLQEAKDFRLKFGNLTNPIYEIQADETLCHRCDMSLLKNDLSPLRFTQYAEHYWSGTTFNPAPPGYVSVWEILLPLPVMIGNRVA